MDTVSPARTSFILSNLDADEKGANLIECLSCGACTSACSWYDQEGGPVPRLIMRAALMGLDDLIIKSGALWDCLFCNRCTQNCPMGISMSQIIGKGRSHPDARNQIPEDIQKGVATRLETGDVNGLTKEEFVETVEWLSEEFEDEVDVPGATIPYDQEGADYLYLPNPRELGTNLLHLTAMARLFYASGETWTLSRHHTDVTNWGYFINDEEASAKMALMVVEPAEKLGIQTMVLSECGHGYHVLKKLTEKLIGRKPGFRVISMPEFVLEQAEKGSIKLDPAVHPFPVAYHDPCNIARKSGLYDAPRKLLALCCKEVVELVPNRENGICCGGGGGMLQDSNSKPKRMRTGKAKADQIAAAGVSHLAAPCLSCHRQLGEICAHFKLDVTVDTIASMASRSLVL